MNGKGSVCQKGFHIRPRAERSGECPGTIDPEIFRPAHPLTLTLALDQGFRPCQGANAPIAGALGHRMSGFWVGFRV